jgi:acetoin utilization protein AcuB
MLAEEIMTEDVVTIPETARLGDALQVMQERDVRHVPVVRGSEIVGILSDRDLRGVGAALINDMETLERVRTRLSAPVTTLMSTDLITAGRETSVEEIIDLFLEEKISAVPVVDEESGELVGIVSYLDVLRSLRDRAD